MTVFTLFKRIPIRSGLRKNSITLVILLKVLVSHRHEAKLHRGQEVTATQDQFGWGNRFVRDLGVFVTGLPGQGNRCVT